MGNIKNYHRSLLAIAKRFEDMLRSNPNDDEKLHDISVKLGKLSRRIDVESFLRGKADEDDCEDAHHTLEKEVQAYEDSARTSQRETKVTEEPITTPKKNEPITTPKKNHRRRFNGRKGKARKDDEQRWRAEPEFRLERPPGPVCSMILKHMWEENYSHEEIRRMISKASNTGMLRKGEFTVLNSMLNESRLKEPKPEKQQTSVLTEDIEKGSKPKPQFLVRKGNHRSRGRERIRDIREKDIMVVPSTSLRIEVIGSTPNMGPAFGSTINIQPVNAKRRAERCIQHRSKGKVLV